jgi:cell division septation protein DedD
VSNLRPKRKTFFLATALYAWGCAGGPPATPLSTTRGEAQAQVVRETFDPRTLKEDLLPISPTFARTTLHAKAQEMPVIPFETSEPEPQTSTEVVTSAPTRPIASSTTKSYRVQLLALSNETVALERQSKLELALKVSVYIEPRRQLFMVQAGDFATPTEAEALKKRAIQLGPDYDDAYIVSVEQITPAETAETDATLPLIESDQTPTPIATDEPIELVQAFGWRVLLDQFLSHEEADRLKRKAMARLNRRDIDVTFKAPWYKVEVGHFEAESEAQSSAEKIKSRYPNALKVRSQILIPKRD